MVGLDLGADRNQRILRHAELGDLALRLDLGDGELAAFGLILSPRARDAHARA